MSKKTLRKNKVMRSNSKKVRRYSNRINKHKEKQLTYKKNIRGGNAEFKSHLLSILNDTYIPFLPTTVAINNNVELSNIFFILTILNSTLKLVHNFSNLSYNIN